MWHLAGWGLRISARSGPICQFTRRSRSTCVRFGQTASSHTGPARYTSRGGDAAHTDRERPARRRGTKTRRGHQVRRWCTHTPRFAPIDRVVAHRTREEPQVVRQHGPTAPPGPGTGRRRHLTLLKEGIHRTLSRQEERFCEPRRAKPRAPVRESPTGRPAKTGNLDGTPKRTAYFPHSRAARRAECEEPAHGEHRFGP